MNGNLSVSDAGIAAISGQTLAGKVLALLSGSQNALGGAENLNLLFGSYEPFLAFASLSGLANSSREFRSLPLPGSVMAFEVFSNKPNATRYADNSNLWVRFLFRNGTAPDAKLTSYPLFGRGKSAVDMSWTEFEEGMAGIAVSGPGDWCQTCASLAVFCSAFLENAGSGAGNNSATGGWTAQSGGGMTPAGAGVLGAGVTVAVALLVLAALAVAGWRVYRRERGRRGSAGLGGFKGAEKLASDVDLTHAVAKDGAGAGATVVRQERVESWEMGMTRGKGGEEGEGEGRAEGEGGAEGEGRGERVRSGADYGRSAEEEEDEVHVSPHADPVKIDDRV